MKNVFVYLIAPVKCKLYLQLILVTEPCCWYIILHSMECNVPCAFKFMELCMDYHSISYKKQMSLLAHFEHNVFPTGVGCVMFMQLHSYVRLITIYFSECFITFCLYQRCNINFVFSCQIAEHEVPKITKSNTKQNHIFTVRPCSA